jgi:hypothetical protein
VSPLASPPVLTGRRPAARIMSGWQNHSLDKVIAISYIYI